MRNAARSLILIALAALTFSSGAVRAQTTPPTLFDLISGNKDLTTFAAALKAVGFNQTFGDQQRGPFTLLAPTNAAFDAALKTMNMSAAQLLEPGNQLTLAKILLQHVVPGSLSADALGKLNGYKVATGLPGSTPTIKAAAGKVTLNDATVTTPDLKASNGLVHIIDKVLVLDAAGTKLTQKDLLFVQTGSSPILDVAAGAPNLKTLVIALRVSTAVMEYLRRPAQLMTVFAPSDAAFSDAHKGLKVTPADLLADVTRLNTILAYHIVPFPFTAQVLASYDGVVLGTVVPDAVILVTVSGGKVMLNNSALVTAADVGASNGIIHVIDDVLLPPAVVAALSGTPAATAVK